MFGGGTLCPSDRLAQLHEVRHGGILSVEDHAVVENPYRSTLSDCLISPKSRTMPRESNASGLQGDEHRVVPVQCLHFPS